MNSHGLFFSGQPQPLVPSTMNAGMQNLVVSLGVMEGTVRLLQTIVASSDRYMFVVTRELEIPFENPQVILYIRIVYIAVQMIHLGVYYYILTTVCTLLPRSAHIDIIRSRSRRKTTSRYSNMVCLCLLHCFHLVIYSPDAASASERQHRR